MTKTNEDERRDYFRINDKVHLKHSLISEDDYLAASETLNDLHESGFSLSADFATLNKKTTPILNNIKQLHPDIGEYLGYINKKIDDLSQHILCVGTKLNESKLIEANLSASGIQFKSDATYKIDQPIKLELVLLPEKIGILIFGRVTHRKSGSLSVNFNTMRPEDKELIIKHNLNLQMLELREKNDFN